MSYFRWARSSFCFSDTGPRLFDLLFPWSYTADSFALFHADFLLSSPLFAATFTRLEAARYFRWARSSFCFSDTGPRLFDLLFPWSYTAGAFPDIVDGLLTACFWQMRSPWMLDAAFTGSTCLLVVFTSLRLNALQADSPPLG